MIRITLVNPNTNEATTRAMLEVAREAAGSQATIDELTGRFGAALICDEQALAVAADAVLSLRDTILARNSSGVVVAAFGDPGHARLTVELNCPVTGIAEAGLAEAARGGRRFAVVTTTPDLVAAITRTVDRYGLGVRHFRVFGSRRVTHVHR